MLTNEIFADANADELECHEDECGAVFDDFLRFETTKLFMCFCEIIHLTYAIK